MYGIIARGYFTELWGNGRRDKRGMGGFWIVYCLMLLPLMLGYFDSPGKAGVYMAAEIPLVWCVVQSGLCPLRLPEMMFLCPMDLPMRRRYIRRVCLFRILLHTAVGAAGALATLAAGNDCAGALGLTLNVCLLSVVGIRMQGDEHTHVGRTVVRCVGVALGVILQIIYVDAAAGGGLLLQARWEQIVVGVMQALFLLTAVLYMTCWRTMQEEAICYERTQGGQREGKHAGRDER